MTATRRSAVAPVLCYHGCRRVFADAARSGSIALIEWRLSQNAYDWLGEGIHFWEGSRSRAAQWAVEHFGAEADVLEVELELGHCLNLLESTYHDTLRQTYRNLRAAYRSRGLTLPKNLKKRHDLDCLVINKFVQFMETLMVRQEIRFQTVRSVFEEGRPLFPGSALRAQSHIQVAVRDVQCIRICS
jgi:hypothetical protein